MAGPINDDFANATVFTGSTISGDNTGATTEAGEDVSYDNTGDYGSIADTGAHTVWYSYTATTDGTATFQTSTSSATDTHLQVFEGGDDNSHQIVEGDLETAGTTTYSNASFSVVAGHTYDIQVGTYTDEVDTGSNQGTFSLSQISGPEGEEPACYLRGTMILTAAGEKPVEELATGDLVMTGSGALRPVKWIGRRSFSARFAGGRHRIQPVCIAAGALGDGVPHRDLWVSPCHAMLIDGLLIPAAYLVNGETITQPEARQDFEYFHIELADHDVVVAEGALAETFLDASSRNQFHNVAEFWVLYPDARPDLGARFHAPRVEHGFAFQAVLQKLRGRLKRNTAA